MDPNSPSEFERDLEALINRHSQENASNTPDFILAEFLMHALSAFNVATRRRTQWYAPSPPLPSEGGEGQTPTPCLPFEAPHE